MVGELCGSRCRQILDDTTRFLILEKMSIISFTQFEEGCFFPFPRLPIICVRLQGQVLYGEGRIERALLLS